MSIRKWDIEAARVIVRVKVGYDAEARAFYAVVPGFEYMSMGKTREEALWNLEEGLASVLRHNADEGRIFTPLSREERL